MHKTNKFTLPSLLIIMLFTGILLHGCYMGSTNVIKGDGQLSARTQKLPHFSHIDISGMFDIRLSQGEEAVVVLETDQNLIDYTSIEVRNNTLYVTTDRDVMLRPTKMELQISYPQLEQIHIGGACKLHASNPLKTRSLKLNISGAAEIVLDLDVEELLTSVSGAANIQLSGISNSHQVSLSGASNLRAENLRSLETRINLSGAGSAHVYASETLHAILSGVGSVRYYGNPLEVKTEKTGLGSIRSAE